MLNGVADTHTLVWYLFGDRRLSSAAKSFIDTAIAQGHQKAIRSVFRLSHLQKLFT
jgi:PIN domain nuclease of toxin-antitoxin system